MNMCTCTCMSCYSHSRVKLSCLECEYVSLSSCLLQNVLQYVWYPFYAPTASKTCQLLSEFLSLSLMHTPQFISSLPHLSPFFYLSLPSSSFLPLVIYPQDMVTWPTCTSRDHLPHPLCRKPSWSTRNCSLIFTKPWKSSNDSESVECMGSVPFRHSIILSFCHVIIPSFCHYPMPSLFHSIILSIHHFIILSFRHSVVPQGRVGYWRNLRAAEARHSTGKCVYMYITSHTVKDLHVRTCRYTITMPLKPNSTCIYVLFRLSLTRYSLYTYSLSIHVYTCTVHVHMLLCTPRIALHIL